MPYEKKKTITVFSRERLSGMTREEMTTAALRWGLVPHESISDEDLINEILTQQAARLQELEASDKERIANPQVVEKAKAQAVSRPKEKPKLEQNGVTKILEPENDRCWIRIASGGSDLEKADVFLAINGESVLIKRGHWVKLRKKFLPVLRDAIVTQVEITDNEEKLLRHVPRFNISVRSLADGKPDESNPLGNF